MDKKPMPFIPIDSVKTQRVEVYINDLQEQLHQLRNKYDSIFIECCDIQKKIQEVSSETISKQQEIGKIITEFEELRQSNVSKDIVPNQSLIGDVKRLRAKFETMVQENLEDLITRAKTSLGKMDRLKMANSDDTLLNPHASMENDPELCSEFESFYSFSSAPVSTQDIPESLYLEKGELEEAID